MRPHGDATRLTVAVVPGARRTAADGLHDGALRVRLAAPPVEGRANEALLAWLAQALGCARRDVRLVRGHASRRKCVEVDLPADVVGARVEPLLAAPR